MSQLITLYDIFSLPDSSGNQFPWSPNTWKIRYVLNIKSIPYKTVWVEMQDIQSEMHKLGAPASSERNGKPFYTLPTIHDPNTGRIITDSFKIAEYLDAQYQDHAPALFPPRTHALQSAFWLQIRAMPAARKMWALGVPGSLSILPPAGAAYYRKGLEGRYALDQVVSDEARAETVAAAVAMFGELGRAIGDDDVFLGGEQPCYADVILASTITRTRRVAGEDGEIWKELKKAQGGRWARYMQAFEKYQTII